MDTEKAEGDHREEVETESVDALCRECGHGFKAYVDRILSDGSKSSSPLSVECPVCGCGECSIGQPTR